jgi:hypothetical protein
MTLSMILRPTGAGYYTTMTPVGLPNNWNCVNEETLDGTKYVTNDGTSGGYRDLYTLTDPVGASGSIVSITLNAYCKKSWASETYLFTPYLRTNSQNKLGTTQEISSGGWSLYYQIYTTNPSTTDAWTWSEIESLQAGMYITVDSGLHGASCAQLWIEVIFTPIPSGRAQLIGLT